MLQVANSDYLAILHQGVETWNRWRIEHPDTSLDLTGEPLSKLDLTKAPLDKLDLRQVNFRKVNLRAATLIHTNLSDADLTEANLGRAKLIKANLTGANLSSSQLGEADFTGADLSGANLTYANLASTNFSSANLEQADLSWSLARRTIFVNNDLSNVRGLDTLIHAAASGLGIDTIYHSKSQIPEAFLRGAGIPDNFIAYVESLVGKPIEFYSCFISYSTKDQEFADRIYADLQSKGVRCWFAPHDMRAGKKLHEQIDEAIRLHDRLLIILSTASMESEWVNTEISKARKREIKEKQRVLFPVRLVDMGTLRNWECFDADTGKDSAREIREFFIPDFSQWKDHDSYQKEFAGLVRDLKAER